MYTHNNLRASHLKKIIKGTPLIWQGETKFQMPLELGRSPTVVGHRPTTTMQNLGVVKKIKVAQKGILN